MSIRVKIIVLLCAFFLLATPSAMACLYDSLDWDALYETQKKVFYYWLVTLALVIPNLVFTLRLPKVKRWFLIGPLPASYHPFITANPLSNLSYQVPEKVFVYLYFSGLLLTFNLIRFYKDPLSAYVRSYFKKQLYT